jgi:hypothetical protein
MWVLWKHQQISFKMSKYIHNTIIHLPFGHIFGVYIHMFQIFTLVVKIIFFEISIIVIVITHGFKTCPS